MKKLLLFGAITFSLNIYAQTFGGGVTDIDGNNYTTVIIGNQEWMAENLRTSRYSNGDTIPNVTNGAQWSVLNSGAWAHFNHDNQYENPYGKLYNWYAVVDSNNVCPQGWHVPSKDEWIILIDTLGGANIAGGKLKSTGTQYWTNPNQGATNATGFSGLPGSYYDGLPWFNTGIIGHYWSSTEQSAGSAYDFVLTYNNTIFGEWADEKKFGFSVRCLSDCNLNLANTTQNGTQLTADQTGATYQWLDCDNNYAIINGETNQSYNPAGTGNYAVEVNMNGCVDTSACFLVAYTGIEELHQTEKELIKIVDFMGRETEFKPNTPLIFIYSDGTRERVMKLEE